MPSANYRRNRRMRKQQEQLLVKSDLPNSTDSLRSAVVDVDNNLIVSKKCTDLVSYNSPNSRDTCSVCNGTKCQSIYIVGACGCKFGNYCFDGSYIEDCCPTCLFKNRDDEMDSFSRNFAEGMVEVGELASATLEDLAEKASSFMTARGDDAVYSSAHRFLPQPMSQRERDAVIRNVEIAKTVVATTATITGFFANGVGSCLLAMGSALSPAIRGISKKILSECGDVDEKRAERMVNGGMEIAKAAIITTGNVARSAQYGTGILAAGVCSSLARSYENAHGFQPGELESHVGDIAKNAVQTAWNVKAMQPKSKLTKISRINQPLPESRKRMMSANSRA